ncbi:MAG: transglutaminase domain-containing protein [Desulfobacterales bacterium]|nr:transglutaminase domain-containing protein [Desulfobacterales bacterium]
MKFLIKKVKPGWVAGILCGVLFIFLLGVRVGFFRNETPRPSAVKKISEKETWMNIFQQNQKIGYAHRHFAPRDNGYSLSESAYMRINTMGMVQDIHIRTKGNLHSDFTLASFDFDLRSSLFHFKTRGRLEGTTLTIFIGEQKVEIPIDSDLYLTAGILDAAWASGLELNQARTFFVFDPATMGQQPVRVTLVGTEVLEIMGRQQKTKKVSLDFMGVSQTAWIGEGGSVVAEEGFLGITIKRVSKSEALSGLDVTASRDLTEVVSVPSNVPIGRADELTRLRLKITGINDRVFLSGGRQMFENGILTILKEDLLSLSGFSVSEQKRFLKPTPFIQSNHPHIKNTVSEVVSPGDSPVTKVQKLVAWVYENIEKRPVLSVPNALETLERRMGDCNEHAVLLAALARAAGIPAQVEAGLVYMKGRFYYHAWNVLCLGRWVTADALMGQMPADVTHIRFVRGEPRQQIDLMGVIGKVKLEILMTS